MPYGMGPKITRQQQTPLSACQQNALNAVETQQRLTSWPYYSTVKFFASVVGDLEAGAGLYTLALGTEVRAFSYAVGDIKLAAGYTNGDGQATIADTNLTQKNQTTGGQNVLIHGIAFQWLPASMHLDDGEAVPHRVRVTDYRFLAALNNAVSCEMSLNGDENTFRMGTIGMVPGAGGLMGGAPDILGRHPFAGNPTSQPYPNNGWPTRSNFFRVPEGLVWRNQSDADSMLNIKFRVTRAISIPSGGSIEDAVGNIASGNGAGVEATAQYQAFPSEIAAELKVFLVGSVVGARTRSA